MVNKKEEGGERKREKYGSSWEEKRDRAPVPSLSVNDKKERSQKRGLVALVGRRERYRLITL